MTSTTSAWSGHWIAPEAPPTTAPVGLGGPVADGEFSRSLFRTTVDLETLPGRAPARLTADSRYVLWVNGIEVGRGPARSQPSRLRYDEHDLAPHLRVGTNVVAVLVTYYGSATSFWQPAAAGATSDARLVFEADLGERELVSDDLWRVHRSTAWTRPARAEGSLSGVPIEHFDAREFPHGWSVAGFDDSTWARAAVVATTHIGGLARTRPPTYPYGRLLPRGISHQVGTRVSPITPLPTEAVRHLTLDFGRIVVGFVELDLHAPRGAVLDLQYREKPRRPGGAPGLEPETGARYTASGDPAGETFAALEVNGLRHVEIDVLGEPGDVRVDRLQVREFLYPRTGNAYFTSSDPELDALYRAGVRTVEANSLDAYTDCPTREQRAWVGDGVVHQMVDLVTTEDWGLARNFLELGDSPRPDGILPMVVVGEIEHGGGLTIPDWSLSWTHGVHVLFRHDGDLETVRRHLPTFERILRWYLPHLDEHGTLADVPEWNLVDWSSTFLTGRSSTLTSLWARSLVEFAELSEAVGNPGNARWARDLHAGVQKGFEDFWDAERGLYVDHVLDGRRRPPTSQAANAAAILSGLVPEERWAGIVDAITDPGRLVVRSWIGDYENGGYDVAKMADQARGVQRIDWDADHEVVLAEPFFSYAVHDAVAKAGRQELLPGLLRRWSQYLVDGYDTFGECWGWGTPVHGWSSTPTRDLVTQVLGITPDLPGYERVRVAPRPGDLTEVAGAVPTPHGPVEVRVTGTRATIDSPVPVLLVHPDGTRRELPAGRHEVTVR